MTCSASADREHQWKQGKDRHPSSTSHPHREQQSSRTGDTAAFSHTGSCMEPPPLEPTTDTPADLHREARSPRFRASYTASTAAIYHSIPPAFATLIPSLCPGALGAWERRGGWGMRGLGRAAPLPILHPSSSLASFSP